MNVNDMKDIRILVSALHVLVGDTGIHKNDCECDNTHKQNKIVCKYCYAREVLKKYSQKESKPMIINFTKNEIKVRFDEIKDKECFYSGGTLYMKILKQDLDIYNINSVNAISIINAGLTKFESDETVIKANKEVMSK